MSTSIMIAREYDFDAISAECPEHVEITEAQALAFAQLVEKTGQVFVSALEGYDIFVDSFALSILRDQMDEVKAIFANPAVNSLLDQILRLDIRLYVTEALGLGIGRYILVRDVTAADAVSMTMSGTSLAYFWGQLGLAANPQGDECGELPLDTVEAALDQYQPGIGNGQITTYCARLRDVIAYGRTCGAKTLYWA